MSVDMVVVGAVIAALGLVLAAYKLIADRREKRPRIRCRLKKVIPLGAVRAGPVLLEIQAISLNRVGPKVILSSAAIRPPGPNDLVSFSPYSALVFPHTLEPGDSCEVRIDAVAIARTLKDGGLSGNVKLRGVFHDATGGTYLSKPLKFDVDEWLRVFGS